MNPYERIVMSRTSQIGISNGQPGSTAACLQVDSEMVWLAPFIDKLRPKTILEIGIYKCGWPYILCPWFAEDAHIIGIDSMVRHRQDGGRHELDEMMARLQADGFMVSIFENRSDAPSTLNAMLALRGEVDLLHIDGAHSYEDVLFDWQNYGPLVRPAGLVVLHDIGTQTSQMNVKRLWGEIVADFPGRTHECYEMNGIGVVEM